MAKRDIRALAIALSLAAAALLPLPPARAADSGTLVYADAGEPSTIDPAKANVNWELTRGIADGIVLRGGANWILRRAFV